MDRFAQRRSVFFDRMEDGVAIFFAADEQYRNADVTYPFRQDTDFYYLTGFEEPQAVAVFIKQGMNRRFIMFLRPRVPQEEQWTGERLGPQRAGSVLGTDEAYPIEEFWGKLPELLNKQSVLYYRAGRDQVRDFRLNQAIEGLKDQARYGNWGPWTVIDPRTILWSMRMYKSDEEIADLQKACDITTKAFTRVMQEIEPGMFEYQVQALLEYEFRRQGSPRLGFDTIAAAGANATTLHYVKNDKRIGPTDMVLLDAGCEYNYITSDVTRTFPAGKRFLPAQQAVYEAVLDAQGAAIAMVKPGNTYQDVHMTAVRVLTRHMRDLGILSGEIDELIENQGYARYFPHRIGHYLGLDVHDCGPYFVDGKSIKLEPGMVLTVEPGLYLPPDDQDIPTEFRGIGVRIEDDVLITAAGNRVLTSPPKRVDQLVK